MTVYTLDFGTGVRTRERKICPLVIKRIGVQLHYFCLASLVFSMAITASMVCHATVVTGLALYITCDVFMVVTTQTKLVLSAALERLMTVLTLMLELGVTLYQFTRGNHRIKRIHVRF